MSRIGLITLIFLTLYCTVASAQPRIYFPNTDGPVSPERKYAFLSRSFPVELTGIENCRIECSNGTISQDTINKNILDLDNIYNCKPLKPGLCTISLIDTLNKKTYSRSIEIIKSLNLKLEQNLKAEAEGKRVYYAIVDENNGKVVTNEYKSGYFIVKWTNSEGKKNSVAINTLTGFISTNDFGSQQNFMKNDKLHFEVTLYSNKFDILVQTINCELTIK